MAWYAFAIFAVVTTVLWGRIYCGRVCAFGALTQLIDAVVPARWRVTVPPALEQRASYIKYAILIAAVGYYLATRQITFYRYIEPFWMFTREGTTVLWIMLAVLLVASVFVRNLYCRFLCPLGAALGLLSTLTVFKIKRWNECSQCKLCEKTCEWGAIRKRKIILAECVRCDDCERLYDDKQRCPHWLLEAKRKARALSRACAGALTRRLRSRSTERATRRPDRSARARDSATSPRVDLAPSGTASASCRRPCPACSSGCRSRDASRSCIGTIASSAAES